MNFIESILSRKKIAQIKKLWPRKVAMMICSFSLLSPILEDEFLPPFK